MMMEFPWPLAILGVAAALAVLVIYDVAYVWPLCRRVGALAKRCEALEQSLEAVSGLTERIALLEARGRDDVTQLSERLGQLELATEAKSYEQAIGLAERGEDATRLMSCLGLTEGEANLVTLLHGERAFQPEARVSA